MTAEARYDAIVLAGGRSSRMGDVDKVRAVLAGRTLLARACDAVAGARRLVVVGPPGLPDVPDGAVMVQEEPRFSGPAAAIGAGLSVLGADRAATVVVVAADVPRSAEAVPALLEALAGQPEADGVVPVAGGHRQPLVAAYRSDRLAQALADAAPLADLSVSRVVNTMTLFEISLADDVVADIDTPADLRRMEDDHMTESVLVTWAEGLAADLGIEQVLDVDAILDLAADAAHGVLRPAAPLTTYLVGVAVGQAGGDPARVAEVLERVNAAIAGWEAPDV
jgi:molybdopterin-guanine dinucleotide biosynthesis protein A